MNFRVFIILTILSTTSCTGIPDGISPVSNFEVERYLGRWHEIARLDHTFERGLSRVSAEYSRREDGGVKVINRGYNSESDEWSEAHGKAYFIGDKSIAHLKVSFFGPFYASYIVFQLGENYEYAFVSGNNKDYLWLLARQAKVDKSLLETFLKEASLRGFDVDDIILVEQDPQ